MDLKFEEDFKEKLLYFLKENQGKAFTIKALEKSLETIIDNTDKREHGINKLQNVLNELRSNEKIKLTPHNGENYYYVPKIFKINHNGKAQYFIPEVFVSGKETKKKPKMKYCKICKKKVEPVKWSSKLRDSMGFDSIKFSTSQKMVETSRRGICCPNCGRNLSLSSSLGKNLRLISIVILIILIIIAIFLTTWDNFYAFLIVFILIGVFSIIVLVFSMFSNQYGIRRP